MNNKLETKIYAKYPGLFSAELLVWGIECDNGWHGIIEELCDNINEYCNMYRLPYPEIVQIKEKFGALRIYMDGADKITNSYVEYAEEQSRHTCESCGETGEVDFSRPYLKCLCNKCRKESF